MKYLYIILIQVVTAFYISFASANEIPKLPYYDYDACPFECCVYGNWKLNKDVTAFKNPTAKSPITFTIKKGEEVIAITGFVVTYKVGVTKVLKPIKMGYQENGNNNEEKLNLKPGEVIYTLHYAGEGYDLFWYKGKTYSDQISGDKLDPNPPPAHLSLQIISRPKADWWVKVKNHKGKIGWIKNPPYFEGSDSCL
jgi:hypothetical protein